MKKLLALFIALMMVFSLAACGNNNTTDPDKDNPGVSQSGENNNNEGAALIDIADSDIRAYASDLTTTLTGDEATAQIAKIPAEIRKGVGEIGAGLCTIAPDYSGDGSYNFGVTFYVPVNSYDEYWKVLTDYYKSLGGTVTLDEKVGSRDMLEIEFSWGELHQCEGYVGEEQATITVGFDINE